MDRHREIKTRSTIATVALAVMIASCGTPVVSLPAASPAPTGTPAATFAGTGMLHLTAAPEYDWHDPLLLRYVFADGTLAPEFDAFPAETTIYLDRELPAGALRVVANGEACGRPVMIQAEVEIDVVLSVVNDVCDITTTDSHPAGAVEHPEPRATIGAIVPVGAEVVVRALDPGRTMAEIRRPANEHGEVLGVEVPPGRYEMSVVIDGEVLNSKEIEIARGQDFVWNLKVVLADVPRDCGVYGAAQCEAIITEAYAWGFYIYAPDQQVIKSVTVRPTRFSGCDGSAAVAKYDVAFDVLNARVIEITVAELGGRLYVCTY